MKGLLGFFCDFEFSRSQLINIHEKIGTREKCPDNRGWTVSCCFPFADLSVTVNSCPSDIDVIAAGQNDSEYLHLAKKGGGHKGKNMSTQ